MTTSKLAFFVLPAVLGCAPTDPAPPDAVPEPFTAGWQVPDEPLLAPDGSEVALSDFGGERILLDLTAMWVAPMVPYDDQAETVATLAPDGLVWVTVAVQNLEGRPVDLDDVVLLAEHLTNPVVGDPKGWSVPPDRTAWPLWLLLDEDRVVLEELVYDRYEDDLVELLAERM